MLNIHTSKINDYGTTECWLNITIDAEYRSRVFIHASKSESFLQLAQNDPVLNAAEGEELLACLSEKYGSFISEQQFFKNDGYHTGPSGQPAYAQYAEEGYVKHRYYHNENGLCDAPNGMPAVQRLDAEGYIYCANYAVGGRPCDFLETDALNALNAPLPPIADLGNRPQDRQWMADLMKAMELREDTRRDVRAMLRNKPGLDWLK